MIQIETDTHAHTVASTHAYSTINEYAQEAKKKGLRLFAITDHGSAMPDSPHYWHFGNMHIVPRIIDGIGVLRGIEANILPDMAELDMPPYPDDKLDLVIASFHTPTFPPQTKEIHTKHLINVIESGRCQVLGHLGNPLFPFEHDEVIRAAKDHNVVIEINNSSFNFSRPGSDDNCRKILECVARYDWKVSFGSDAHIAQQLGIFDKCLHLVDEISFPYENIVSRKAENLLHFLAEHNKPGAQELLKLIP